MNIDRILIVGDDPAARRQVGKALTDKGFDCAFAASPGDAREALEASDFSLLLCRASHPVRETLTMIREMQGLYPGTAAIVLTDRDRPELGAAALDLGLAGYLVEPIVPSQLLINVDNALRRRQLERASLGQYPALHPATERAQVPPPYPPARSSLSRDPVDESLEEMLIRLCHVAEFRDLGGDTHIQRVSTYAYRLARQCGLSEHHAELVRLASRFHDVGNVCVPYKILSKPGRLTDREFQLVKLHTEVGYRMLSGTDSEVLDLAASIALNHHERFDGTGYPAGLMGDDIPVEARIITICDVYDTLTSQRVYKPAYPPTEAQRILRRERCAMFDPDYLDLFLELQPGTLN